ncbi:MAG: FKBP-type peptidyl-prolyl cis-trans isomerase [Candidatus Aenigmarchaeota archaeon]|nr:FKBP-type peptidyl-prolyl cis-trans isomerase [Candidatus Aenigmarchaeota archaeon]
MADKAEEPKEEKPITEENTKEEQKAEAPKETVGPVKKESPHHKKHQKPKEEKKENVKNTSKDKKMPKTGMILGTVLIIIVVAAAIALIFMPAPVTVPEGTASDGIKEGDAVTIKYKGTLQDGTVFDEGEIPFVVGTGQVIEGFEEGVKGMTEGSSKTITIPPEKAYGEIDPTMVIPIPLTQEFDKIVNISKEEFTYTFNEEAETGKEYKLPDMKWSVKVLNIEENTVFIEQLVTQGTVLEYPYGSGVADVMGDKISISLTPTIGAQVQTLYGYATITEANDTYMWLDFNHELAGKTLTFEITVTNVTKFEPAEEDENILGAGDAITGSICGDADIVKTTKPKMEVFVMALCPFGLQMQKGVIPVAELFGDKADIEIKFVNYAMHGKEEIDYNTYQYCIQKDQPEKFWQYLRCFVGNGNHDGCAVQIGLDTAALSACVAVADEEFEITKYYEDKSSWASGYYPLYKINEAECNEYGVQGSPTIVINGKVVQVYPRDPETVKTYLCCAFENPPAECSQTLSSENPSSGLGWSTTDSGTAASCG